MKNLLDKKALELIEEIDWDFDENTAENKQIVEYLFQNSLWLHSPKEDSLTHDEFLHLIFEQYQKADKKKNVALFLSSLSTHRMDYRLGLGAMAIMKTFPQHLFYNAEYDLTIEMYKQRGLKKTTIPCSVCNASIMQPNLLNQSFSYLYGIGIGSAVDITKLYLSFYISNKLEIDNPTTEDIEIFREILLLINSCDESTKANDLRKKLTKSKLLGKENVEQVQSFLELLGYCGILHSEKHKGYFYEYKSLGCPPRKSRSSDWGYPMDFWTGKDKIDKEALLYWFSDEPAIIEIVR